MQQILWSHELNNLPIFDLAHPKFIPEFAPPCKKSVHFIYSFLKYTMKYVLDWPHPFLSMLIQKCFDQVLIYVN